MKLLSVFAVSLLLSACGSKDSEKSPKPKDKSQKVASSNVDSDGSANQKDADGKKTARSDQTLASSMNSNESEQAFINSKDDKMPESEVASDRETNQCNETLKNHNPNIPSLIDKTWASAGADLDIAETGPYYDLFDAIDDAASRTGEVTPSMVTALKRAYHSGLTGPHPYKFESDEILSDPNSWDFLAQSSPTPERIEKHLLIKGPFQYDFKDEEEAKRKIFLVSGDINLWMDSSFDKLESCLIVSTGNVTLGKSTLKCSVIAKGSIVAGKIEGGLLLANESIRANPVAYDTIGWRRAGQINWQVYPPTIAAKRVEVFRYKTRSNKLPLKSPAEIIRHVDVFSINDLSSVPLASKLKWLELFYPFLHKKNEFIVEDQSYCIKTTFDRNKGEMEVCPVKTNNHWHLNYYVRFNDGSKAFLDGASGESKLYNADNLVIGTSSEKSYVHLLVNDYNMRRKNAFEDTVDLENFSELVDPWKDLFPKISKLQKNLCPVRFSLEGNRAHFGCESGSSNQDFSILWQNKDDYEHIYMAWQVLMKNKQITVCDQVSNGAFRFLRLSGDRKKIPYLEQGNQIAEKVEKDLRKHYYKWGVDSYKGIEFQKDYLASAVKHYFYLDKLAESGLIPEFKLETLNFGRYIHLPGIMEHVAKLRSILHIRFREEFRFLDPKVAPYFYSYLFEYGIIDELQKDRLIEEANQLLESQMPGEKVDEYFIELKSRHPEIRRADYEPLLFLYQEQEFLRQQKRGGNFNLHLEKDGSSTRVTVKFKAPDSLYYQGLFKDRQLGEELLRSEVEKLGLIE